MADINPKPQEVADKVGDLRESFKKEYKDSIDKGLYDQRDLDRLDRDDAYARCFLRTLISKGVVKEALPTIDECFRFRKEIGLNDIKDSDIPDDIKAKKALYYQGTDKQGHPILYIDVKQNNVPSDQIPLLKKYIAYVFEQHHGANPEQMCLVLFDMSGASTTNLNMDITKYIITSFTHYFPVFLAYCLNYEMPFLLSATWKLIGAFLKADQKKKMLTANKKDIANYISDEHLWPHMK